MHGHVVDSVTFSRDGETLAVGASNGGIYLWNLTQKSLEGVEHSYETWGPIKLAAQPETQFTHPLETLLLGHTGTIERVAFSPDGHILASASGGTDAWGGGELDGTIRLWDVDPEFPQLRSADQGALRQPLDLDC